MISQLELNHGAAMARLCRGALSGVRIRSYGVGRSAYVLDERVALYLKYSSMRMSPWSFSFSDEHQAEIERIATELEGVFIGLICGSDGIACLDYAEYSRLLDNNHRPMEWVKASRRTREKYTLTGSDNIRAFKIGDSEYPAKIYAALS